MEYLNIVVIALLVGLFFYLILTQRRGQKGQDNLLLQQQINDLKEQTREGKSELSNLILRTNEALNSATNTLTLVQGQMQLQMDTLRQETSSALNQLTEQLSQRLSDTHGTISSRLEHHANIVKEVHGKLEGLFQATQGLSDATRGVLDMKRDIVSLQESFKAPKFSGNVGEMLLERLLKDSLPSDLWELQHPFRDGTIVDAVIKMEGKLVPVDAKFPLDNFMKLVNARDDSEKKVAKRAFITSVKTKIEDIAKKYIRPDEATYDYAFMYIPAEGVYHEITTLNDSAEEGLLDYAWKRKVYPISPNTFWAYLQTIHFGLKALKLEEEAEEVIKSLRSLKIDFGKFREDFETLGKHLRNAGQKHDEARKDLDRFSDRLDKIESLGGETASASNGPGISSKSKTAGIAQKELL